MTNSKTKRVTRKTAPKSVRKHLKNKVQETDGQYLLKTVIVFLLGTIWVKLNHPFGSESGLMFIGFPIGFFIGLFVINRFASDQIDRKIWYVLILIVTLISLFLPIGIIL